MPLERAYEEFLRQYDAMAACRFRWQAGIESMITGFHERFNPQGIKNCDAKPFLDPSLVQRAMERLKLKNKVRRFFTTKPRRSGSLDIRRGGFETRPYVKPFVSFAFSW